jgi:acyl-CoA synthetase (AMP-forming)/AMP-acid ligase II
MDHSSIHDAFAATADRTPDRDFLVTEAVTAQAYGIPEGTATWRQAREQVERLRRAYAEAGWGHGHRVGLLLENRPAFLYHWLALNALGVSVVPVNAEMRLAELSYLIGHSEVGLIVSLPQRLDDLREAAREAGRSVRTMTADDLPVPPPASPAPLAGRPVSSGTECALLYTSGTTGRPKGCMLDNAYFLRAGQWYSELGGVCAYRRDQERVMTPLPLNHVNAMAFSTMVVLVAGGCLIQLDRFHPKSWLESARVCGATIVHYLGVMPAMLLSAPPAADRDHRILWGFGAGVDKKNHAPFEERFGFPLVEAWAMTETGAAACIMADKEPRHVGTSCFGRCEDFVQIRLVDDAGSDVPDGTPGELLVRSSGGDPRRYFFRGYLKDQAATDAAWADGWFHTGDVVCRDGEGSLYFVDRKKNVIRRSGENIAAVEVESVLNRHPAVRLSAVAAAPDEVRGDEVMACIVLNEDAGVAADESLAHGIVRHALAQLAYYKAPGYVAFVDALPLTTSQKIQRGALKQLALSLLSEGGCFDTRSMKRRQV